MSFLPIQNPISENAAAKPMKLRLGVASYDTPSWAKVLEKAAWAMLNSVQVMLFRDRLEVWSPGTLPRGMTVPKLFKAHQSLPVNPLLARAMYLKGYIEKTGTGTEDMIAKCAEWGVAAPEWIEEDDVFRVVLKRPAGSAAGDGTVQETTRRATQRIPLAMIPPGNMRNIVSLVQKNPRININGMAHALGLSPNGVKYHLKQLRKIINIKHVGAFQAGNWELSIKESRP